MTRYRDGEHVCGSEPLTFHGKAGEYESFVTVRPSSLKHKPSPGSYFVWAEGTPFVKIGTGVNPEKRVRELACASPHALHLMCVTSMAESLLHSMFNDERVRDPGVRGTEWFRMSPRLLEFAATCHGWRDVALLQRLVDTLPSRASVICGCEESRYTDTPCPHHAAETAQRDPRNAWRRYMRAPVHPANAEHVAEYGVIADPAHCQDYDAQTVGQAARGGLFVDSWDGPR